MSTEQRTILARKIEGAFSDTKYPGDNAIVPLYDGVPHCNECAELEAQFKGKVWKAISLETLFRERFSLSLFTAAAFRYYIPAYLRGALLYPRETDTLWENNFHSLT